MEERKRLATQTAETRAFRLPCGTTDPFRAGRECLSFPAEEDEAACLDLKIRGEGVTGTTLLPRQLRNVSSRRRDGSEALFARYQVVPISTGDQMALARRYRRRHGPGLRPRPWRSALLTRSYPCPGSRKVGPGFVTT